MQTPTKKPSVFRQDSNTRMEPSKLNLWLIMMASSMLFAGILSAFIVAQPDAINNNVWEKAPLPFWFMVSAITVAISSVTMILAKRAALSDELSQNKLFLFLSLGLGLAFCYFQYLGWGDLVKNGFYFVNPTPGKISGSFVYAITGVHVVHLFGGLVLMLVTLGRAYAFKVHKKEMRLMNLCNIYWHFVGLLWIILYLFLYFAG